MIFIVFTFWVSILRWRQELELMESFFLRRVWESPGNTSLRMEIGQQWRQDRILCVGRFRIQALWTLSDLSHRRQFLSKHSMRCWEFADVTRSSSLPAFVSHLHGVSCSLPDQLQKSVCPLDMTAYYLSFPRARY